MTETYTLVLRSESLASNPLNRGTIGNATYRVDWVTLLPQKYKKFHVASYFRTGFQAGVWSTPETIVVHTPTINNSTSYDSANSSRSSVLAVAERVVQNNVSSTTSNTYFISRASDLPTVTVNYPSESFINVQLKDTTNTLIPDGDLLQEYILLLNFTPIES